MFSPCNTGVVKEIDDVAFLARTGQEIGPSRSRMGPGGACPGARCTFCIRDHVDVIAAPSAGVDTRPCTFALTGIISFKLSWVRLPCRDQEADFRSVFCQRRELYVRLLSPVLPRYIAQVRIMAVTVDVHHCILTVNSSKNILQCSRVVCRQIRRLDRKSVV